MRRAWSLEGGGSGLAVDLLSAVGRERDFLHTPVDVGDRCHLVFLLEEEWKGDGRGPVPVGARVAVRKNASTHYSRDIDPPAVAGRVVEHELRARCLRGTAQDHNRPIRVEVGREVVDLSSDELPESIAIQVGENGARGPDFWENGTPAESSAHCLGGEEVYSLKPGVLRVEPLSHHREVAVGHQHVCAPIEVYVLRENAPADGSGHVYGQTNRLRGIEPRSPHLLKEAHGFGVGHGDLGIAVTLEYVVVHAAHGGFHVSERLVHRCRNNTFRGPGVQGRVAPNDPTVLDPEVVEDDDAIVCRENVKRLAALFAWQRLFGERAFRVAEEKHVLALLILLVQVDVALVSPRQPGEVLGRVPDHDVRVSIEVHVDEGRGHRKAHARRDAEVVGERPEQDTGLVPVRGRAGRTEPKDVEPAVLVEVEEVDGERHLLRVRQVDDLSVLEGAIAVSGEEEHLVAVRKNDIDVSVAIDVPSREAEDLEVEASMGVDLNRLCDLHSAIRITGTRERVAKEGLFGGEMVGGRDHAVRRRPDGVGGVNPVLDDLILALWGACAHHHEEQDEETEGLHGVSRL